MKVAVAGATGFIGSYIIDELLSKTDFQIVALSRNHYSSSSPRVECRRGDLYSLLDCESLLEGCDVAIYLVHSMMPSSRLSQGDFRDFDFILADNFSRAAAKNRLQKIIYVGGLLPEKTEGLLSRHLSSRLEVEKTLSSHGTPCVTLRCGIVIGRGGSSFAIVENLVSRLPLIVLPQWAHSLTQSVYVYDLVHIVRAVVETPYTSSRSFDIGHPDRMPYAELLKRVSRLRGRKNWFFSFPFIPRAVTKLWVRLFSSQSKELVYPLIDSLIHPLTVQDQRQWRADDGWQWTSTDIALQRSLSDDVKPTPPLRQEKRRKVQGGSLVQSVQRLPAPLDWTMKKMATDYIEWLPRFLWPFLQTRVSHTVMSIHFRLIREPMLVLELSERTQFEGRELFYIRGGILAKTNPKARLEFRMSPDKNFFIAAIHSFEPALPWYIYRYTQAFLHEFVMTSFGKRLSRIARLKKRGDRPAT